MKRFLKGFSLAGLAALVLMLSACDLTELNENPNESADVTTPNLLVNAQFDAADNYWLDYAGAFWIRYAQYWTTNQYTEADRWAYPTRRASSNDARWNNFYLALNDLQEIIRINRETPEEAAGFGPAENQIAIAMTMQAFIWQMMTDIWGPIPFEEALQGRGEGNFTPAYTSQEAIYQSLLQMLTEASDMIVVGSPALSSGDLVYGGDMSQWKKLANSLKMRVAIRMADVAPGDAQAAIEEALAAGAFESNADNAVIPFSSSPPYQNPFYEQYEVDGRDDWAAPEPILGLMNEVEDPRRAAYFTEVGDGEFNAFPYGLPGSDAQSLFQSAEFSRPSLTVRGEAGAPAFIMFYDEVLFTLAEAAERWGIGNQSASAYYEDAIEASLMRWGTTDQGTIDAYIAGVPYDNSNGWAPATSGVEDGIWEHTIGVQKWLALYLQGIQGWAEVRRLDFQEVLQEPVDNPGPVQFGCAFPLRMNYPDIEVSVNEENRNAAVDGLLGDEDDQGTPLWWDAAQPTCGG